MTTIKETTINQIDLVLSEKKKFYRNSDFPFPVADRGYSTHQGAVLRKYLAKKGFVKVRVSEVSMDFFADVSNFNLKSSNGIIMLKSDFEKYSIIKQKREAFAKKPEVKQILVVGMGKVSRKQDLIDKYTERLNEYNRFEKEMGHTMTQEEKVDSHYRKIELEEFIKDLNSL